MNIPRRVPLMGGLGLVYNDRRSYRERRLNRHSPNQFQAPPCALLQYRDDQPALGLFGNMSAWTRTAIGAWLRRHVGYPWRSRPHPPAGRP